jgi:hypothetical protein
MSHTLAIVNGPSLEARCRKVAMYIAIESLMFSISEWTTEKLGPQYDRHNDGRALSCQSLTARCAVHAVCTVTCRVHEHASSAGSGAATY